MKTLEWDENLLKKYNVSGPRYTSYPTALEFSTDYQASDYLQSLKDLQPDQTLSLYIHIPFCQNICYYCACNKIITKDKTSALAYIENITKEISIIAHHTQAKTVRQIHWGGGTPTYLSIQQIAHIMSVIRKHFIVPEEDNTEISIEVDPRTLAPSDVSRLAELGFNRMSLGVQDFDLKVQQSINRVQSFESSQELILAARKANFQSINIDLIYGLPFQTKQTFDATLEKISQLSADRISIFNYAHLPHRFKPQRRINSKELPSPITKLKIFESIISRLQSYGYLYIGMDHFAKPQDELAIAQKNHQLHRNFQGYTTHPEYQLIGIGVSSISAIGDSYHQNVRDIKSYYEALEKNELPSWRGAQISRDDKIRRSVIFELICHFQLDKQAIEKNFQIDFDTYFCNELKLLEPFVTDQLLQLTPTNIEVTIKGRLLIRTICMVFDAYFNEMLNISSYSKII